MKQKIKIHTLCGMKEIETNIYNDIPDGWDFIKGALTAPKGYEWISNGKSIFSGERQTALLKRGSER